jgi:hypothetical protein
MCVRPDRPLVVMPVVAVTVVLMRDYRHDLDFLNL